MLIDESCYFLSFFALALSLCPFLSFRTVETDGSQSKHLLCYLFVFFIWCLLFCLFPKTSRASSCFCCDLVPKDHLEFIYAFHSFTLTHIAFKWGLLNIKASLSYRYGTLIFKTHILIDENNCTNRLERQTEGRKFKNVYMG